MLSSVYSPLPVASRYLVRQFFAIFVPIITTFVLLYVIVDFFDRLDILLEHDATVSAATRYFLFKIPLMVTQVTPPAVITAVLLSLGLLARHNEMTAFRAGGVSLVQTAMPILVVALLISVAALAWNETVVPYSSRVFQRVNNVEIRKRELRAVLSERHIWYHGARGFYHIDHVNKAEGAIYGLVIYRFDDTFNLQTVIEISQAHWVDGHWRIAQALERRIGTDPPVVRPLAPEEVQIPESLDDFLEVQHEPEEMSYLMLRRWVADLTRKGIDVSQYYVELQLKLALPFASAVLAVVGAPIGGRVRRNPSIAAIVGSGIVVGFAYGVVFGLASSLGQNGVLPPVVAAWAANVIFLLLGVALFLYSE